MMYDKIKIWFKDRTITIIYVSEDDDVVSEIARMCDEEGYNSSDVVNYAVVGDYHA